MLMYKPRERLHVHFAAKMCSGFTCMLRGEAKALSSMFLILQEIYTDLQSTDILMSAIVATLKQEHMKGSKACQH